MKLTLCLKRLTGELAKSFQKYSKFNPTPLSLKKLYAFSQSGKEKDAFEFLRLEIPVRIANIMKEIQLLPDKLLNSSSGRLVTDMYEINFKDLLKFEKLDSNDSEVLHNFVKILHDISRRNSTNADILSEGVMEMRDKYGIDQNTNTQLNYFLDRYYLSRISIRLLINQHVISFHPQLKKGDMMVGVEANCDVVSVVNDAYDDAKFLCEHYYLKSPELKLVLHNDVKDKTFVYIRCHLYHIVFEILKNSMRAIVEFNPDKVAENPINVLICKGKEDLMIRISDRGGGISRSMMGLVFNYTFSTTTSKSSLVKNKETSDANKRYETIEDNQASMAGYGYGLSLSRLYARYFSGDLIMMSTENYGTVTCIYLKLDSNDADELLPVFSAVSTKKHTSQMDMGTDWSR